MKKKILTITGIIGGIVLLAGAAFLAARLLAPGGASKGLFGNVPIIQSMGKNGTVSRVTAKLDITPAKEVPARAPDMNGAVTEIKDNSLMVTKVEGIVAIQKEGGEVKMDMNTQGPTTEVVVTKETQVYLETTFANRTPEEGMPAEGETIQQTVEPASLSDIGPNSMITVWGYKRGDRLMAEVIVYHDPFLISKGGK